MLSERVSSRPEFAIDSQRVVQGRSHRCGFDIIDSDLLLVAAVTVFELLNPIVASVLVSTLLFPAISTYGTLSP